MFEEPKYKPLVPSSFFTDGRSARPVPPVTFTYGQPTEGDAVELGTTNGKFVATIPIPVDEALLLRGQDRFNIYCAPCHSRLGDGNGKVPSRGFRHPPTYHQERLRKVENGYIFDVITNGFGVMPDYAAQVPPRDRWAIVAYIRALQLSENATIDDVPPEDRGKLDQPAPAAGGEK